MPGVRGRREETRQPFSYLADSGSIHGDARQYRAVFYIKRRKQNLASASFIAQRSRKQFAFCARGRDRRHTTSDRGADTMYPMLRRCRKERSLSAVQTELSPNRCKERLRLNSERFLAPPKRAPPHEPVARRRAAVPVTAGISPRAAFSPTERMDSFQSWPDSF